MQSLLARWCPSLFFLFGRHDCGDCGRLVYFILNRMSFY
ncbi:Uncharacterised protein [Vibrio cholerae]|nr:Uncharacterised protein [Vibrio cholerae]